MKICTHVLENKVVFRTLSHPPFDRGKKRKHKKRIQNPLVKKNLNKTFFPSIL